MTVLREMCFIQFKFQLINRKRNNYLILNYARRVHFQWTEYFQCSKKTKKHCFLSRYGPNLLKMVSSNEKSVDMNRCTAVERRPAVFTMWYTLYTIFFSWPLIWSFWAIMLYTTVVVVFHFFNINCHVHNFKFSLIWLLKRFISKAQTYCIQKISVLLDFCFFKL